MFSTKRILATAAVVALAAFPSCNSDIDDPDGPNVFLEVENVTIPPVTAEIDPLNPGVCIFTITNATATFKNKPKNSLGVTSPFNDITLLSVHISYIWGPGIQPLNDADFGVGGTVPANGTAPAQFAVIDPPDLAPYVGRTGSMVMTFFGRTISGEDVSYTTGGALSVGSCS